jgi:exonuclease III
MSGNTMYLSILTPNVNGLNVPNKRHRIANLVKKQDQTMYCLQETYLTKKKINSGLESKGRKMFSQKMSPINRQE